MDISLLLRSPQSPNFEAWVNDAPPRDSEPSSPRDMTQVLNTTGFDIPLCHDLHSDTDTVLTQLESYTPHHDLDLAFAVSHYGLHDRLQHFLISPNVSPDPTAEESIRNRMYCGDDGSRMASHQSSHGLAVDEFEDQTLVHPSDSSMFMDVDASNSPYEDDATSLGTIASDSDPFDDDAVEWICNCGIQGLGLFDPDLSTFYSFSGNATVSLPKPHELLDGELVSCNSGSALSPRSTCSGQASPSVLVHTSPPESCYNLSTVWSWDHSIARSSSSESHSTITAATNSSAFIIASPTSPVWLSQNAEDIEDDSWTRLDLRWPPADDASGDQSSQGRGYEVDATSSFSALRARAATISSYSYGHSDSLSLQYCHDEHKAKVQSSIQCPTRHFQYRSPPPFRRSCQW